MAENFELKYLRELHLLTIKRFDSLDVLFSEYLEKACEIFSLDLGIVSKIYDDTYEIQQISKAAIGVYERGQKFALSDTLCRRVFKEKRIIAFHDLGEDETFCAHPLYTSGGAKSFISAPVVVNEKLFGTFNLSSASMRAPFEEYELRLFQTMADSLSMLIENWLLGKELEQQKEQLFQKSKLSVLGSISSGVAHEINNPLAIVKASTSLLQRDFNSGQLSQEKFDKKLDVINLNIHRIHSIVKSLQQFNKTTDEDGIQKITVGELAQEWKTLISSSGVDSIVNKSEDLSLNIVIKRTELLQALVYFSDEIHSFIKNYGKILSAFFKVTDDEDKQVLHFEYVLTDLHVAEATLNDDIAKLSSSNLRFNIMRQVLQNQNAQFALNYKEGRVILKINTSKEKTKKLA